jgi:hypothetical protein
MAASILSIQSAFNFFMHVNLTYYCRACPNIWTLARFQITYCLPLYCDTVLHFVHDTLNYAIL